MAQYGSPQYLGTITSTTTKNNSDTSSPFPIPLGAVLLIQCSAACHVLPGITTAAAVTTSNGIEMIAKEKFTLILAADEAYLAVVGSADTKVWQLR